MSGERPWEEQEEPVERDVLAAELVGDPGPDGVNPLSTEMGDWVARAIESIRARARRWKGLAPAEAPSRAGAVAGQVTTTTAAAVEGTLKSKSLEGQLKEAQILDMYASARQKNAEAEKLTAEAAKLRQDAAFERLERAIALIERLGAPVGLTELSGGALAVTVGERLAGELPGTEGTGASADLDTSDSTASSVAAAALSEDAAENASEVPALPPEA